MSCQLRPVYSENNVKACVVYVNRCKPVIGAQLHSSMPHLPTIIVGLISLILAFAFYLASTDIPKSLSPQGCRMSWMSPSYILQSGFNSSWSPLAERYSLWLYREVGWEGTPVRVVLLVLDV